MIEMLILGLCALLLGLAGWTVIARDAFTAVVSFIAYGLLLTLAWVHLRGVDVALTEAAIGAGLTGALLINAAARLRRTEATVRAERPAAASRRLAACVSACLTLTLGLCVLMLPDPAPSLAHEVVDHMGATGLGNPITAVLLAFRAPRCQGVDP